MTGINWTAPAKVTLFTRQSEYERGKTLYNGNLAGAVQAVMNLPGEKRAGARIFTDKAAAHTQYGFFGRSEIEELAARDDFPGSSPTTRRQSEVSETQPVMIEEFEGYRLVVFRSVGDWAVLITREGERPSILVSDPVRDVALMRAKAHIGQRQSEGHLPPVTGNTLQEQRTR